MQPFHQPACKFLISNFFCSWQKYRLGKQSGKDMGEAPKDGACHAKKVFLSLIISKLSFYATFYTIK